MKKTLLSLLWTSILLASFSVNALTNPPSGQPKTFLGPTLQLNRYDTVTDTLGFSVLGEAGPRNFRASGTVGWAANAHQRIKLSAEYLWQDLTYAFFSGNTNEWVSQGALGLAYQADFPNDIRHQTQFHLQGFLSHAPSKNLSNVTGTYLLNNTVTNYTDFRRIAGSNAGGLNPGISFLAWEGGLINVDANYDNVRYDTINTQNQDAKGMGGTLSLNQRFVHQIDLNALASVRAPFNQYAGDIGWTTNTKLGQWRLSIGSDYVIGKNTLPSSYSLLLSANYLPNQPMPKGDSAQLTAWRFLDWLAKPAVYLPQVLAIPDERVGNCLGAPVVIGQIGSSVPGGVGFVGAISLALNTIFSGEGITYTINYNGQPNNGSLIIVSGTLTGNDDYPNDAYTNVSVTATNSCGSVTSNLFQAIKS